jgi:hypothetical protein
MNQKALAILVELFCLSLISFGQGEGAGANKVNTLYLEFAGTGGAPLSINYDRVVLRHSGYMASITTGLGYCPIRDMKPILGVPFTLNLSVGKTKHFLELGSGITYNSGIVQAEWQYSDGFPSTGSSGRNSESLKALYWTFRAGYKYQRPEGGLFFRIGFTPMLRVKTYSNLTDDRDLVPAFGLGMGHTF